MEIKKIPGPGPGQNEIGWEVKCEFLEEVMPLAQDIGDETVSMEQVQAVILALFKLGYCEFVDEDE